MDTLTPRERVRKTLNHEEPDRIPIDTGGWLSGICYIAYENLKKKLGVTTETTLLNPITGVANIDETILKQLHIDTRYIYPKDAKNYDPKWRDDNSFADEWGIRWRKPQSSYYYDVAEYPLRDAGMDTLKNYQWPDPKAEGRTDGLVEKAQTLFNQGYAIFTVVPGPFEFCTYLRCSENLFVDTVTNVSFFDALLDKVTEILIELNNCFLDVVGPYIDNIMYYSDLGDQRGPLINPRFWREHVKSREIEYVKAIKRKTKAKVSFHTCGTFWEFREDVLQMGIDVMNPIQTTAADMEPVRLKKYFGKRMSYWGGVDGQRILPFGSPEEVRNETRRMICALGPGGGYIFGSCHNIQNDVPPENILALFNEAYEFGTYPLVKCGK